MNLLQATDLFGGYGGGDILQGACLHLDKEEIVVIIGPNGAGKSSMMKAIFGLMPIRRGEVIFNDENINRVRPEDMVQRGIAYVPQERNVFSTLTVQENLEMGAYQLSGSLNERLERIYEIFPKLKDRRRQQAGLMSGGERQMVAIGRALMIDPLLLMLDEPTAGLSPLLISETFDRIRGIRDLGIGVLMVEQNARQALTMADRGYVMTTGMTRFHDTGAKLLANREIAEMFLGG
ncbi:MAG: ABC transporter ATP-binding protein [Aquisalimonadaceae bacterium]